jgi:hypothetical protein
MTVRVTDEETYEALAEHVARFVPGWDVRTWSHGDIVRTIPRFRVLRVAPEQPGEHWVYISNGAWEATKDTDHGLEFFIVSAVETDDHVETLAAVAARHADARYRMSLGKVFEIGVPWVDGSAADHFFVTLPFAYGEEFEICHLPDRHVQFFWLLPITRAEAALIRERGIAPFEELATDSGLDFADPQRPSLA